MQDTQTGDLIPIDDASQEARDRALPRERQGVVLYIGQPIMVGEQRFAIARIERRELLLTAEGWHTMKAGDAFHISGATFWVKSAGAHFIRLQPAPGTDLTGTKHGDKYLARIDVDGVLHEQLIQAQTVQDAEKAAHALAKELGGLLFELQ